MIISITVLLFSLIGLLLSVIFYAVDHDNLPGLRKYTGFICNESVCKSVLILDDASLFWIKNYYVGGLYFITTGVLIVIFMMTGNLFFTSLLSIISLFSLFNAAYLFVRLVFIHKINCVFCFSGQFLVLLILVLGLM